MAASRLIEKHLKKAIHNSFAVVLLGPVGSGKTTLIKEVLSKYNYVNLKDMNTFWLAKNDPIAFFKKNPPPIILDEIQRLPELLDTISNFAKTCEKGQFILVSSHELALGTLAEHTSIVRLLPFSIPELAKIRIKLDLEGYIHSGFMPDIHVKTSAKGIAPSSFYGDYFSNYLENEVWQLINEKNKSYSAKRFFNTDRNKSFKNL